MSRASADIAIIGGGVIGCALAYDLARQGAGVTLFERRELAREASWASAGIISPPAPRLGVTLEIARIAYRRYPGLIEEIEALAGFRTGWYLSGQTLLAAAGEVDALRDLMDWYSANDIRTEWLDQDTLREREPAVAERFTGASFAPEVGSVRLDRVCRALAAAAAHHGAVIREHELVLDIEIQSGRASGLRTIHGRYPAGMVIVAAGAWSRSFSDALDIAIPTVPIRGQMLSVFDAPLPVNSVLAYDGVYLVPRADGTVAVGATEEPESGFDGSVTPEGIRWLTEKLEGIAPSVARGRLAATWAGLRPGTTHGRPVIGALPHLPNVWIVTGHFRSGALLAPGTSELVARSILSGEVDPRLGPLAPAAE
jgi:glycine oxidase